MRFCPKCSLKIKGSITQCPICKVELLSCADDEEMDTGSPEKGQQDNSDAGRQNASQPFTERSILSSPPDSALANGTGASAALPHRAVDKNRQADTIPVLEQSLKSIEQKLSIHMAKEEVITRSLVELETRISKIEKSLIGLEKSQALSNAAIENMKKEPAHLTSPAALPAGSAKQIQQTAWGKSAHAEVSASPQHSKTSPDFPPSDMTAPEENTGFFSETPDDFDAPLEKEDLLLKGDRAMKPPGERKKTFFTIVSLFFLLALLIGLAFYYNSLQNPTDQKRIITEEISLTPAPAPSLGTLPGQNSDPQRDQKPEIINNPAAFPPPVLPDAIKGEVLQEPLPQQEPLKTSAGFTVSVGSFRDKANAAALTSKLNNKGYPALTVQSKQKQFFRVSVGTFSTRNEAMAMARILAKKEKLPTAVVSTNLP